MEASCIELQHHLQSIVGYTQHWICGLTQTKLTATATATNCNFIRNPMIAYLTGLKEMYKVVYGIYRNVIIPLQ
jgi:hypothetical protein